ncbi:MULTISPECIES: hypothetical protein [Halorussus]|uniref:DUF7504 family protein n=1 Tax=Halorussus TaxID=1070314 RepID=UPI000E216A98|nr:MULTISPECIES: hypothetical protein [Halorussus]NHN58247.1 hypothetical protein [Halorussus sp. JP-T4]
MSQHRAARYEFAPDLPLEGVDPGTTLLVAGPTMSGARRLALRLVTDGNDRGEGMILLTTNKGSETLLGECDDLCTGLANAPFGVVDCVSKQQGNPVPSDRVETVSSPGDLTGVGIEFSGWCRRLREAGTERVRTGLYSLSTLLMYTDFQTVSRFVHTLGGRISATDGLGVFLIDPATQDDRVVSTMTQFCDARVDVREGDDGNRRLRVRGLSDQPGGWTSY